MQYLLNYDAMMITPIPIFKDNYVWAIINPTTRHTWIVDPGDAAPVISYLHQHQLHLSGILITHHHWDHTNGVKELKDSYKVPVIGPNTIAEVTESAHDNQDVTLSDMPLTLRVLSIPGHTLDHLAYYAPGILFCGDTLFAAGCGRVFEGTAEQMFTSLNKLKSLPDDTGVYCGHEYTLANLRFAKVAEPDNRQVDERINVVTELRNQQLPTLPSTLREEKATNPFLRCTTVDAFSKLRTWKNEFV